ncbi:MAG TPA: NAD-dependent epimerase/dehydratase family protein [Actinomycetales bacterium]|nr:NAD-dependent epimerase/dehydratase family protein [Actinomycetales bacterium]
MRIVITGASGNVGTALLRQLSPSPDHQLVGVARRPPGATPPYDRVEWVAADLAEPDVRSPLESAMRGADAVVHLAWGFQPSHDMDYLGRLGVGGTAAVITAADAAGVQHLVHMSSVGAYAKRADLRPVDESWPATGVPTSPYSRHKAAAESLLDAYQAEHPDGGMTVTRLRPGLIGQRMAGSELLRYGVPAYVPGSLLRLLPVFPVDRSLVVPMVHADDVAAAIVRVLELRAAGAFNLAAEPPVTRDDLATAFGARPVHLPAPVLRLLASAAWHARLQPVDPGWVDLGFSVPLLDSGRARAELGWTPTKDSHTIVAEVVAGMTEADAGESPPLRRRTVLGELARSVRQGPPSHRRLP